MHPVKQLLVIVFSLSFVSSALSHAQADNAVITPTDVTTPDAAKKEEADLKKQEELKIQEELKKQEEIKQLEELKKEEELKKQEELKKEELKKEKELKKKEEEEQKKQAELKRRSTILGWKEWVWAIKPELVLRAKLDTGAHTSSIHATNIEEIEIDGKKWIKFTIYNPNDEKGIRIRHKAPLSRVSKIKNDSGGVDQRYVVPLVFQIGDTKLEAEFNLNDRERMTCSMLLGRNILKELGMIDSGRSDLLPKPKNIKPIKVKPNTDKPALPLDQK